MDFGARDSIPTLFHHIGFSLKFGGIAIFFDLCFTAVTTRKQRFEYTEEVHKMGDSVRYPVMKSVKDAAGIPNPLNVQHPPGAALQLHDSVDLNKIAA